MLSNAARRGFEHPAMLERFQPLLTWLREQNKGVKTGWTVAADPLKTR